MNLTPKTIACLKERLLESIDNNDYETYTNLCDVNLSAFEPEAMGQRGRPPFHAFYQCEKVQALPAIDHLFAASRR